MTYLVAKASAVAKFVLMSMIRLYQLVISPLFPQACRFQPTCSQYTLESVRVHGAWKGTWLGIKRVARCHPWNPGGLDPVPPPTRRKD